MLKRAMYFPHITRSCTRYALSSMACRSCANAHSPRSFAPPHHLWAPDTAYRAGDSSVGYWADCTTSPYRTSTSPSNHWLEGGLWHLFRAVHTLNCPDLLRRGHCSTRRAPLSATGYAFTLSDEEERVTASGQNDSIGGSLDEDRMPKIALYAPNLPAGI